MPDLDEIAKEFIRQAIKRGMIIEAGWLGFRALAVHKDAPPHQLQAMRGAFYAGSQHLFASIMASLDLGSEPTPDDLHRMEKIKSELDEFSRQFKAKHGL